MSAMLDEIHEQPKVVAHVLEREKRGIEKLCKAVSQKGVEFVIVAGRGTSDHAATVVKYLLEIVHGIPVALAAPSVVTLYHSKMNLSRCLVLGISQGGESTDVVEYVDEARKFGALTACVCNEFESPLSRTAEYCLFSHAGEEKAVSSTKTYTGALAACYLFALTMAGRQDLLQELEKVPECIAATLETEETIHDIAPRYRYMDECFVMSRGINHATAYEAAMKIAETSYVGARPYSTAEFVHGPIAVVHEGFSCFLIAPEGKAFAGILSMITTLARSRAETIIYSSSEEILRRATTAIRLNIKLDEMLTPLVYIVPAQLFAYYLSITKGYNPDRPRHLQKIR